MVQSKIDKSSHSSIFSARQVPIAFFLFVGALWVAICYLSRQPGSLALPLVLLCSVGMVLATAGLLWHLHRRGQRISFRWVFLSALALRLISLWGEPLFEDDYYRYLWDGFQTVSTNDPYTYPPDFFFDAEEELVPEVFEPILSFINYPDVATVYGPVTQWMFAAGYLMAPAEVWPLQLLAGLADVMVLLILFKLGAGNALLLYAWSPLLLKEFSLTAHPDILAVLCLMLSVYAAYRNRAILAGAALAFAFGAKVFAILALPYLLTRTGSIRFWSLFMAAFIASLALMTLAFGTPTIWAPEGLKAMADSWLFNAPLYLLLLNVLNFQTIKILLLSVFVLYGFVVFCWRFLVVWQGANHQHDEKQLTDAEELVNVEESVNAEEPVNSEDLRKPWLRSKAAFRGDWLFGFFLLCLPVLNPWYMAFVLPFAVLYPSVWAWTASVAVLLSYWYGSYVRGAPFLSDGVSEELPNRIIAIEFALILVMPVVAWAWWKWQSQRGDL